MAGKTQMQGRNTVTQEIVTWLADGQDWQGEQSPVPVTDIVLYARAQASVGFTPIAASITAPASGDTLTEGQLVVITFALTRPGTAVVELDGADLGAGVMSGSGLAGYFLWTPVTADIGGRALGLRVTDAANGTTASAPSVAFAVIAAAAFPSGLTTLLRFDPSQPAYQDLAQSTPATAPTGRVRSIPQPPPLSGSWAASSDQERPVRDYAGTLECDPLALDYPTHNGQFLNAPSPSSPIAMNDATLAFSFRPFAMTNAPANGLLAYATAWGLEMNGAGIALRYNGGAQWYAGILLGKDLGVNLDGDSGAGNLVCIVARFRPTGLDIYVDEEGFVYNPTPLTASITGGAPGYVQLGMGTGLGSGLFGQAAVLAGSVSDAKRDELIAWMKARGASQAFPTHKDLVAVMADSIGAGVGNAAPQRWSNRMLANLRSTYPTLQMLNVSIGGSGVPPMSGPVSTQYKTVRNHLSTARRRSVVVLGFGTNDIKGDPTDAGVDAKLAMLFALSDDLRSRGALVAVENVLPRSDLPTPTTQTNFNHGRTRWNNTLDANVGVRFDRLIDLRGVSGVGADGDSDNLTYYPDKIHPSPPCSALIEPAFTAAVAALLV